MKKGETKHRNLEKQEAWSTFFTFLQSPTKQRYISFLSIQQVNIGIYLFTSKQTRKKTGNEINKRTNTGL